MSLLMILIGSLIFALAAVPSATDVLAEANALELQTMATLEAEPISLDDVNLATGAVESPENMVKTLRSNMLSEFEAQ